MGEADLNKESCNAANYYMKQAGAVPLVEKTNMLNYTAHGFFMGYRKCEEDLGIKSKPGVL